MTPLRLLIWCRTAWDRQVIHWGADRPCHSSQCAQLRAHHRGSIHEPRPGPVPLRSLRQGHQARPHRRRVSGTSSTVYIVYEVVKVELLPIPRTEIPHASTVRLASSVRSPGHDCCASAEVCRLRSSIRNRKATACLGKLVQSTRLCVGIGFRTVVRTVWCIEQVQNPGAGETFIVRA